MAKEETSGGGMGFLTVLFLIFLTLKLTDTVDWSWWWVISPIWLPFIIILVIVLIARIVNGGIQ